ncbi:MAG: hypothetical protein ABJB66_20625 [Gemmatimonadaceae bacterium]
MTPKKRYRVERLARRMIASGEDIPRFGPFMNVVSRRQLARGLRGATLNAVDVNGGGSRYGRGTHDHGAPGIKCKQIGSDTPRGHAEHQGSSVGVEQEQLPEHDEFAGASVAGALEMSLISVCTLIPLFAAASASDSLPRQQESIPRVLSTETAAGKRSRASFTLFVGSRRFAVM